VEYAFPDNFGVVQNDVLGHNCAGTAPKDEGALTAGEMPYQCRGIGGIGGKTLGIVLRPDHDALRVAAAIVSCDCEVLGKRFHCILEDDAISWGAGNEQEMGAGADCVVVQSDIR
jgi:hypothetical protein